MVYGCVCELPLLLLYVWTTTLLTTVDEFYVCVDHRCYPRVCGPPLLPLLPLLPTCLLPLLPTVDEVHVEAEHIAGLQHTGARGLASLACT